MNQIKQMAAAVLTFAGLTSMSGFAQDRTPTPSGYVTHSVIEGNALSNVHGRTAVNMAAGDSNAQINAGALAINLEGGTATAQVNLLQTVGSIRATAPDLSVAIIGGRAFANSSGAISVNQASGVGNTQANGMAIAVGIDLVVVSESLLAATATGVTLVGPARSTNSKAASISDTAFQGSSGLVQVNQSAGSGNSTANNFALQLQLGTKP